MWQMEGFCFTRIEGEQGCECKPLPVSDEVLKEKNNKVESRFQGIALLAGASAYVTKIRGMPYVLTMFEKRNGA